MSHADWKIHCVFMTHLTEFFKNGKSKLISYWCQTEHACRLCNIEYSLPRSIGYHVRYTMGLQVNIVTNHMIWNWPYYLMSSCNIMKTHDPDDTFREYWVIWVFEFPYVFRHRLEPLWHELRHKGLLKSSGKTQPTPVRILLKPCISSCDYAFFFPPPFVVYLTFWNGCGF